ncbi:MAG: Hsp20/alpha crystallin family protein [Candidatus Delongbacteria bacterium]|nr:Hsp20/alpha crystallin family protein [Candidatus Delongbacteria bacterium]MBN2834612.1 Hsp20/alpha crystallin family protein [Candidatus Delongbacteria bacterium]
MLTSRFENFGKLFEDLFENGFDNDIRKGGMDIYKEGDFFYVDVELPGIDKEKFELSLDGNYLSIKAERSQSENEEKRTYYKKGIKRGVFNTKIFVPSESIDSASIVAEYKDGILRVQMRNANPELKKIEVKYE